MPQLQLQQWGPVSRNCTAPGFLQRWQTCGVELEVGEKARRVSESSQSLQQPHEQVDVHAQQLLRARVAQAARNVTVPVVAPHGRRKLEHQEELQGAGAAGREASPCASASAKKDRISRGNNSFATEPRGTAGGDRQLEGRGEGAAGCVNPPSLLCALRSLPVLKRRHRRSAGTLRNSTHQLDQSACHMVHPSPLWEGSPIPSAALPAGTQRGIRRLASSLQQDAALPSASGKRVRVSFASLDALLAHCLPAPSAAVPGAVGMAGQQACEERREEVAADAVTGPVSGCDFTQSSQVAPKDSPQAAGIQKAFNSKVVGSAEKDNGNTHGAENPLPDLNTSWHEGDEDGSGGCIAFVGAHQSRVREVPIEVARCASINLNVVPSLVMFM